LRKVSSFVFAGLANYFMISYYFAGRLVGHFSLE
jgi:hypothetical protein